MTDVHTWRWVSIALWLVWSATYWRMGLRALRGIVESFGPTGSAPDRVLMVGIPLLAAGQLAELVRATVAHAGWPGRGPVAIAGTLMVGLGMVGTYYCRRTLGRFWAVATRVTPGHAVVDTGPYATVRHPIYLSAVVIFVGTALVIGTTVGGLLGALLVAGYVAKAQYEDDYLRQHLPGYAAYQQRVRRKLLPALW